MKCKGTTKKNQPCHYRALNDGEYCKTHSKQIIVPIIETPVIVKDSKITFCKMLDEKYIHLVMTRLGCMHASFRTPVLGVQTKIYQVCIRG